MATFNFDIDGLDNSKNLYFLDDDNIANYVVMVRLMGSPTIADFAVNHLGAQSVESFVNDWKDFTGGEFYETELADEIAMEFEAFLASKGLNYEVVI